ncbi:MAG: Jag N-terminal domain-containing protein [Deltaproteobacteria bacterium]|nr:Jag N-terminal domain-containing protein [Deltaproteobacteria bacterium]
MNAVEAEGRTIEEAVATALAQLKVERERVEIEILSQATKGFLGIGGKKARVRATLRAPLAAQLAEPAPAPVRKREEGRSLAPSSEPVAAEAALPSREIGEKACQVLAEVLRLMGIKAALALETRDDELVINIAGVAEGVLIGRNGQTLDALEYVLSRIVTRSDESDVHLALDAEGYRERRRKNLEHLALRLGERAKRRRKPVALSPLSPRDRRVIHLALEGDPLVTTKSMGRGYFRRLFIVPEEGPRRERGRGGPRMQASD